mmetsp:Transcript_15116/g.25205  ORF Transcript_15116/g.25205 Transcript_15116/m.25205 type:complete len:533 (+) Transcript_15116:92-1690(+)
MLKRKKGKRMIINVNVKLLYSENNIWSARYKAWNRYFVRRPALPSERDKEFRLVDEEENSPRTFNNFVGNHNVKIIESLNELLDKFEYVKAFPEVLCIYGPSGSGKSSLVRVFVNGLVEAQGYKPIQADRWVMTLDANHYKKDLNTLWARVTKFVEPPLEKYLVVKFRLLVIDNFHMIPPSSQQILKRIMERYSVAVKYLFICPDPKQCMTGFVLAKTTSIKTRPINEKDCLRVVLALLYQHRIGFERDGIKDVFQRNPGRSLSKILDMIQEVFVKTYFVSKENVVKIVTGKAFSEPPIIAQHRAVEPYERCKLCTLIPPCQHISLEDLIARGVARRKELPRYKVGSMPCPEFVRYGYCSMFNKNGHCSLDHPKNVHRIQPHKVRCAQCSIVWPCNHCDFTKFRVKLIETIAGINARLGRIRSINVPDPPISLTRHLETIVAWREQLRYIGRKYTTAEYTALIENAQHWLDSSYSIRKDEYRKKEKTLREAFGEMYTTHILEDPLVAQQRILDAQKNSETEKQQQQQQQQQQ